MPLRTREEDFYDFGGRISFTGLKNNHYVHGINKRLQFVEKLLNRNIEKRLLLKDADGAATRTKILVSIMAKKKILKEKMRSENWLVL